MPITGYLPIPGNLRFVCPRCKSPTIYSARLPFKEYSCPTTGTIVTEDEILQAKKMADVYGPEKRKLK